MSVAKPRHRKTKPKLNKPKMHPEAKNCGCMPAGNIKKHNCGESC